MKINNLYSNSMIMAAVVVFAATISPVHAANNWLSNAPAFITPLESEFALIKRDPIRRHACRGVGRRLCPEMLVYGGTMKGGLPTFDPPLTSMPPKNVRVLFVLQRITVVGDAAEAGVTPHDTGRFEFNTNTESNAADLEMNLVAINEDADELVDVDGYFHNPLVLYNAIVLDGCTDFSTFPVSHFANYEASGADNDPRFSGTDNTTIDSTGYYNFNYTLPVETSSLDEQTRMFVTHFSGLHLSGKVSVICTADTEL